jgi:RNA polymerase sigma factor (TIGR02999 family)
MQTNFPSGVESSPGKPAHLSDLQRADSDATADLLVLNYPTLHRIAAKKLNGDRLSEFLEHSDVQQEACLRMIHTGISYCKHPAQFNATASRVIKNILVDESRKQMTQKRGGGVQNAVVQPSQLKPRILRALDEVLRRLKKIHPRKAEVVRLRFFSGLTWQETAEALGISMTTAKKEWFETRHWLRGHLEKAMAYRVSSVSASIHAR